MNIIILHGTGGSPEGNWFQWLKTQLGDRGHTVYVPRFPTPEGQSVEAWRAALGEQAPQIGKDTILIGHSCGAAFMLHILESLNQPVAQSVFVSGFIQKLGNEFFDNLNKTFTEYDFNWDKIRANMGRATLLWGNNDPYVPRAAAAYFSQHIGVPLTIIPNGGHLNAEFGYTEFPQVLDVLDLG
ncbi:MAG: alpha/beta hydrolase [Proteobacteria bacterium]|nr:alpha/beta hydrolase [Pseudomonadota bacterium]